MFYTNKPSAADREASQRAMEAQQREESAQRLVGEVCQLLNDDAPWEWTGSNADLMEALHTAYLLGDLYDDRGQPYSFTAMVRRACHVLRRRVPRNPCALAARAVQRKGVRRTSFFERYCRISRNSRQGPLTLLLRRPAGPHVAL